MTDNQPAPKPSAGAEFFSPGATNVKLIYGLYLAGFLVALTPLIGVIMAYINRGQAGGWVESHYTYIIRTFWIGLLYSLVCVVLSLLVIGVLLFVVVAIWAIVRCIRGLQWSTANQPVPDPQTWLI